MTWGKNPIAWAAKTFDSLGRLCRFPTNIVINRAAKFAVAPAHRVPAPSCGLGAKPSARPLLNGVDEIMVIGGETPVSPRA